MPNNACHKPITGFILYVIRFSEFACWKRRADSVRFAPGLAALLGSSPLPKRVGKPALLFSENLMTGSINLGELG